MDTNGPVDINPVLNQMISVNSFTQTLTSGDQFQPVEDDIATIDALKRCNRLLQGYKTCLKVIGWHQFVENPSFRTKIFHSLWISVIFLFILITLGTKAMSCFRRDLFQWVDKTNYNSSFCGEGNETDTVIRCDIDFVSVFAVPGFLLLATYIYGIYLFWDTQEYLENLAGQVYLNNKDHQLGHVKKHIVSLIILYFSLGILYIIASLIVRMFHSVVFNMFDTNVAICWKDFGHPITGIEKKILLIVSLVGFIFHDGVYVAAVINYAIQSELNISLLWSLCVKVKNREYDNLDVAIKDIDSAYRCVKVLNGKTSTLIALVLFNFVSNAMEGIIALGEPTKDDDAKGIVVLTLSAVLWSFLAVFPFIQATRVTRACTDLLSVGSVIRIRPLQYKDTPQLDLDSFCIYTSSIINMRAEIFGVPIFPWMTNMAIVTFAFVMLLLCQNGIYYYAKWL